MLKQDSSIALIAIVAFTASGCGGGGASPAAASPPTSASAISQAPAAAEVSGELKEKTAAGQAVVSTTTGAVTTATSTAPAPITAAVTTAVEAVEPPQVQDIVLVASTRIDRTKYDYKFKLLVKGAYETYESGAFSVAKLPQGSVATVGTVTLGQIDALRLVPTTGTITLRHDRTLPFVKSDLKFDFVGKRPSENTASDAPKIGPLKYYAAGGRPGHEGYFENASSNPVAGTGTQLQVVLSKNTTVASYTFKSASGMPLASGPLTKVWAGNDEATAMVDIPAEPFTVTIAATSASGTTSKFTSGLMQPQTYALKLAVENGAFNVGRTIRASLDVGKAAKTDLLVADISLPDGFSMPQTHFEILVGPSSKGVVPLAIETNATTEATKFHKISITYYLKSAPTEITTAIANVFAR